MTKKTETPENVLNAKDEADFAVLGDSEAPKQLTLLEIWKDVLSNIEISREERISPQIAMKALRTWGPLSIGDLQSYFNEYHDLLMELREILHDTIRRHPDALDNGGDKEAELNHDVYVELLLNWQIKIGQWEDEWDVSDPKAHVRICAIADASTFFVGSNGLVEHFTEINFHLSDEERESMLAEMLAAREDS